MILSATQIRVLSTEQLQARVKKFKTKPQLVIIRVGKNDASEVYVNNKIKYAQEIGINARQIHLQATVELEKVVKIIRELNEDKTVNGILVQLPLPKHLDQELIINAISPEKDVDGFTKENIARLYLKQQCFIPCTVAAINDILSFYDISVKNKNVVIIGRSNIVGKPLFLSMLHQNATPTLCHSQTKDLKQHIQNADILISAVGSARFLTDDFFTNCKNLTIIDVGINRDSENKLCGDVDFINVEKIVENITPVPRGVGVMTVANVVKNTIIAYENQEKEF